MPDKPDNNVNVKKDPKLVLGQLIKSSLDPIQENILKTVQKAQSEQIQEAISQGVPAESILQQSNIPMGDDVTEMLSKQFSGKQSDPVPKEPTALFGLIRQAPAQRQIELQNAAIEQQLRGETPIQQSEIQKIALQNVIADDKAGSLTASNILNKFEPIANNFQISIVALSKLDSLVSDVNNRIAQGESGENNPNLGPADIGIVFSYMKILDPRSTVREGEQASVRDATGVPDRIRNLYNSLVNGATLNAKQRKEIVRAAKSAFEGEERNFKQTRKQFVNLANKNKIDPDKVLRNPSFFTQEDLEFTAKKHNISTEEVLQRIGGQ